MWMYRCVECVASIQHVRRFAQKNSLIEHARFELDSQHCRSHQSVWKNSLYFICLHDMSELTATYQFAVVLLQKNYFTLGPNKKVTGQNKQRRKFAIQYSIVCSLQNRGNSLERYGSGKADRLQNLMKKANLQYISKTSGIMVEHITKNNIQTERNQTSIASHTFDNKV
eukprot:scaffold17809_cov115-Cylindrotheca_fusiformis.AAC.1